MTTIIRDSRYSFQTTRSYTEEGFLRVVGAVSRSGIQEYLTKELGIKDRNPDEIIRVYRPESEVFDSKSLASFLGADVTDDHPKSGAVDSESFRALTRGSVLSEGRRDGDFVVCDMLIKDKEIISKIEAGKAELSAGYSAEFYLESGVTSDGHAYDCIQKNILINHVAVVDRARAGAQARIFDSEKEVKVKIKFSDSLEVELSDSESSTSIIAAQVSAMQSQIEAQKTKISDSESELEALKAKFSDEAISVRFSDAMQVMEKAKYLAGSDFVCDSISGIDIKKKALESVGKDTDGKCDEYISGIFDSMHDMKKEKEVSDMNSMKSKLKGMGYKDDELEKMSVSDMESCLSQRANDSHHSFADDVSRMLTSKDKQRELNAYQKVKKAAADAWKGKQ